MRPHWKSVCHHTRIIQTPNRNWFTPKQGRWMKSKGGSQGREQWKDTQGHRAACWFISPGLVCNSLLLTNPSYHYSHYESIWFWSLLNIIWPLNPMMEQRQAEWDTGKPGPVSWKAMAGRNGSSCKCVSEGTARLVLGWAALSELWVHFEQPHVTNIIFHYSPTVLSRGKCCTSSNLSPGQGKGTRSPGCQAYFLLDNLPSYPNHVTRHPCSATWHQRLIHTRDLQPEQGILLGGKTAAGSEGRQAGLSAHRHRAVWLLGAKHGGFPLCCLHWKAEGSGPTAHQCWTSTARASLYRAWLPPGAKAGVIHHLSSLSTLSMDSKANN